MVKVVVSGSSHTRPQIKVRSSLSHIDVRLFTCTVAAAAMHAMNGAVLGSKQLVVRLHEPKQLRQEKLAQRFGGHGNGHPRSGSGATSPTASEAGDYAGWSPTHRSAVLGSPIMGHTAVERTDRARRSSGSYYHVCLFCHITHLVACLNNAGLCRLRCRVH